MSPSIKKLGTGPTPQAVNAWMQEMGLSRTVVGTSLQGRELLLYELSNLGNDANDVPTVLFLSLVHGNEPMGLLSLVFAAQLLQQASSLRGSNSRSLPARILFFPIVNVDAYTLNIEYGQGCRRTNLRPTCNTSELSVWPCPEITQDGVDLNRNFPADWGGEYAPNLRRVKSTCSPGYRGPSPFSEPETQAIRDVVLNYNVRFAMSFHSLAHSKLTPLIIHPYASSRPLDKMDSSQRLRYREWSEALNPSQTYITGTAQEAIKYSASGTTIDWLQSMNITAFVLESAPPCNNRWCPRRVSQVMNTARQDGVTARRFVELIVHNDIVEDALSVQRFWIVTVLVTTVWLMWKWRRNIVSTLRRFRAKEKLVPETELQSLTSMQ